MTLRCERVRTDGSVGLVECDYAGTGFCDLLASKGDTRLSSYSLLDTDSDGYPDFQDRDADNDELPDATEAPGGARMMRPCSSFFATPVAGRSSPRATPWSIYRSHKRCSAPWM